MKNCVYINILIVLFLIFSCAYIYPLFLNYKRSALKNRCGLHFNEMEINEKDSFYIHLFSNVETHESFRNNTVAKFVTKLAEKITLTDEYEVGLSEISYTKSWYNLKENASLGIFTTAKEFLDDDEVKLRAGYYPTVESLVEEINVKYKVFESTLYKNFIKRAPALRYDSIINRVFVISGVTFDSEKLAYPNLTNELELILGLRFHSNESLLSYLWDEERNEFKSIEEINLKHHIIHTNSSDTNTSTKHIVELESPYPVQFNIHNMHLLVYCSIIQPVLVGNTYSKLLRLVEIPKKAKFGEQCVIRYPEPFYYPLLSQEFEVIEIVIRDDTGELIPFDFGRSTITLHFRKKSTDDIKSIRRILH